MDVTPMWMSPVARMGGAASRVKVKIHRSSSGPDDRRDRGAGDDGCPQRFSAVKKSAIIFLTCFRSSMASREYHPWRHRALRERFNPSSVLGPVDAPPCFRQREFREVPGRTQGLPCRVIAPQGFRRNDPAGVLLVVACEESCADLGSSPKFMHHSPLPGTFRSQPGHPIAPKDAR